MATIAGQGELVSFPLWRAFADKARIGRVPPSLWAAVSGAFESAIRKEAVAKITRECHRSGTDEDTHHFRYPGEIMNKNKSPHDKCDHP